MYYDLWRNAVFIMYLKCSINNHGDLMRHKSKYNNSKSSYLDCFKGIRGAFGVKSVTRQ